MKLLTIAAAIVLLRCDHGSVAVDDSTGSATQVQTVGAQSSTTRSLVHVLSPPAPLRVGGDVLAPVITRRVDPVYPEYRGTYRQGILVLECVITEAGDVRDLRVIKGPGNSFEQAILDAVNQWKFKPGTLHGKPVAVIYNLTVNHVPYGAGG